MALLTIIVYEIIASREPVWCCRNRFQVFELQTPPTVSKNVFVFGKTFYARISRFRRNCWIFNARFNGYNIAKFIRFIWDGGEKKT